MSKIAFFTAHSCRYASFDSVLDIEKYCSFHVNISLYTNALFVKQRPCWLPIPTRNTYSYFVNSVVIGVRKLINLSLRQFSAWKVLYSVWTFWENLLRSPLNHLVLTGLVKIPTFPGHYNQFNPGSRTFFCQISFQYFSNLGLLVHKTDSIISHE